MDALRPLLLTLLLMHVTTVRAQCPSVHPDCTCSYKDSVIDVMSCTHMGQHDNVPEIFNGTDVLLQNLQIGGADTNDTVIRTLQNSAFDGMRLRTLTLTNIGIEIVEEEAFGRLGEYLESLYIDQNSIRELPVHVFRDLTELIYLHLEHNQLSSINRTYFQRLSRLQHLHLRNNLYTTLPLDTFQDLTQLDRLSLDSNGLTEVRSTMFDSLTNMKMLNLQSNDITDIAADALSRLTLLERVELQRNHITQLAPSMFENNRELDHFDISFNNLQNIPPKLFSRSIKVHYIDFGFNNISELVTSTFRSMRQLEYLFLRDNQLSSIPTNLFENLIELLVLDLQNNNLNSLQIDYFPGLNKLKELRLQHNQIRTVELGVFDDMMDLQLLDLSANQISVFTGTGTPFGYNRKLESLHLNDNNLMRITKGLFRAQAGLQYLYLQRNHIISIESESLDKLYALKYMDLSENWLTDLSGRRFRQLINLETLKLSRNPLMSLGDVLVGLTNLRELHLNNSCFEEIPFNMIGDLRRIETIYLRHNTLGSIPRNTFVSPTLQVLDLAYCDLQFIAPGAFNGDISELHLMGNPLQCDCNNTWLRSHVSKIQHPQNLVCTSPQTMANYYTLCYPQTSCHGVEWDTEGRAFCMSSPMVASVEPGSIELPNDGIYVDTSVCDLSKYPGLLSTTQAPTPAPDNILDNLVISREDEYFVFRWDVATASLDQIEGYAVEFTPQSGTPSEFDTETSTLNVPVNALQEERYTLCVAVSINGRRYNGLLCGEFIRAQFTTTTQPVTTPISSDVTTATPESKSSKGDKGFSQTLTIVVAAAGGVLLIMVITLVVCCVVRKSNTKHKDPLPPPYTEFSARDFNFKMKDEQLVEQSSVSFPGSGDTLPHNARIDNT